MQSTDLEPSTKSKKKCEHGEESRGIGRKKLDFLSLKNIFKLFLPYFLCFAVLIKA